MFTPSRRVGGKRVVCYDDRFIVKLAFESDGVVVSNDTYRDLQSERQEWKRFIEERLLMYSFVNDKCVLKGREADGLGVLRGNLRCPWERWGWGPWPRIQAALEVRWTLHRIRRVRLGPGQGRGFVYDLGDGAVAGCGQWFQESLPGPQHLMSDQRPVDTAL